MANRNPVIPETRVQGTVVLQQAPWRPAGVAAHFLSTEIKGLLARSLTPVEMSSRNEVQVKERRGCSQKITQLLRKFSTQKGNHFGNKARNGFGREGKVT